MDKLNKDLGVFRDASKQKRKNARIKLLNVNGIFFIEGKNIQHECSILDIGTGGLGISTKTLLYPGDKIQIQFWIDNQFFDISGVVSRVSGKNAGIIFEKLDSQVITKIQDYIHSKLFK